MKQFLHNKWLYLSLCCVLLIPTFFINNRNTHDWGGDFAMYIKQAQLIADGEDQLDNNYIFNPEHNRVGPASYPIGFPLLLSPFYKIFGNNMAVFTSFIAVCYYLLGVLSFIFFASRLKKFTALILALVICYNPMMLEFKSEVMSDLPFALFILASIIAFDRFRHKTIYAVAIGFLFGFTVLIRSAGLVIIGAHILFYLLNRKNENWKPHLAIFATSVLTISIFNLIITGTLLGPSGYGQHFENYSFLDVFYNNLHHLSLSFQLFFGGKEPHVMYLLVIFRAAGLIFALLTLTNRIFRRELGFEGYILIGSLSTLALFPYTNATGIRLLIPLFPLFMLFFAWGIREVNLELGKVKFALPLLGILIIGLIYQPEVAYIIEKNNLEVDGPMSADAQECFNYITMNTEPDAVILFQKPRVLGLYADRDSWSIKKDASDQDIRRQIITFNCTHILLCSRLKNEAIDRFATTNSQGREIWSNNGFTLIKI